MALKDFVALIDEKLHDAYHYIAADPAKARKPFLKGIERTQKQFAEGKQPRGDSKWWSANNNVVMFSPNLDGEPVKIGPKYPMPIPAERFGDALASLKSAVEAGELDDQLVTEGGATAPKAPRKPRDTSSGEGRSGWSEDRRRRFEESIAARKAAKEAAAAK